MKGIKMAAIFLFSFHLLGSGAVTAYAEPESGNIIIQLELSQYDTFDETIKLTYLSQNTDELISLELNQANGYRQELFLPEGSYQFNLSVESDRLQLIHLDPARLELEVNASNVNTVQTVTIHVSDSAALSADSKAGEHEGITSAAGEMDEVVMEPYHYEYSSDTLTDTGVLKVTGPDIAGVQSMSFCIKNKAGEEFYYELRSENGFKAEIELPYGLYKEVEGRVEVIPEDEITIPPDAEFYYEYYGNKFGMMFRIDESNKTVSNPKGLQLWVKRSGGANYEIPNFYKFTGDGGADVDIEAEFIGHEEAPLQDNQEGYSPKMDNLPKESETALTDIEQSSEQGNIKNALLLTSIILLLFTGAAIGFLVRHCYKKE